MRSLMVAVRFLTRLPLPESRPVEGHELPAATAFFPWVGAAIGAATAGVLSAADLLWPVWIAVLLALAFEAVVTGALHEDAVADFFDAFGGGWTRDDVLRILKDSRLGSFGALALLLLVALRAGAMTELAALTVPGLMMAAGLGRWTSVLMMVVLPPVSNRQGLATDVGRSIGPSRVAIGALGLLPVSIWLAFLAPWHLALALLASAVVFMAFKALLTRRLGGHTGDCLGCLSYLVQVTVLLALVADVSKVPSWIG